MKIVTFASFKGGAGKSTSVMAVTSSLISKGKKIALFDADENEPLIDWEKSAHANNTWSNDCQVFSTDDLSSLEEAYEKAEKQGFDLAIIDTRGGGSELNNTCLTSANLIAIPSALTTLDMTSALSTFEHAVMLLQKTALDIPVALLIQRAPIGKLTTSQQQDLEKLSTLPMFETHLHARDAFAALGKRGMLHLTYKAFSKDAMKRLSASHIATAMKEADLLANDIVEALGGI